MAKKLYEEANIQDIAVAIREKNGAETKYKTSEMGNAVRAIQSGGISKEEQTKSLDVTENGTYTVTPDDGKVLSSATVNVDVPIPDGYVQPTGELEITENGTYDVTNYASTVVSVEATSSGGEDTLLSRIKKTLTVYAIYDAVELPQHLFNGCTSLTKLVAPNLIGTFPGYVFYGCGNISYIDMGKVTKVTDTAVTGCHRIKAIILRNTEQIATLPTAFANVNSILKDNYVLSGVTYCCYFYVPRAFIEEYKTATNWSVVANRFRILEDYTLDGTTDGDLDESKI